MGFSEGPHLERVERKDNHRWALLAIGLGIVLVALAAVQPWTSGKPTQRVSNTDPNASVIAAVPGPPSGEPQAVDRSGLYPQCFPSTGWRVASQQQAVTFKVRTAWPVTTAPLPSAAGVNTPTLFGSGVEAIGFCTPGIDELTRSQYVGDVSLWRRAGDGAVVEVADAGVLDPELAAQGEVYLTPPVSISTNGTWPPGDYFFQLRPRGSAPGTVTDSSRWLAMKLVPDGSTSSPNQRPFRDRGHAVRRCGSRATLTSTAIGAMTDH